MQRDGGQAAAPAKPLLPPPDETGGLPPVCSVIRTHCRDPISLPMQHIVLANRCDAKEQDTEEPKKRKGGWPKGKKRKPARDISVPRAPVTGYVIFLNEQRNQLRAKHPDLPFTEITKMLAAQWAQLSQEKKQRYVYEADEDKQRYIRELQAYQSSQACRAFLRRQAAQEVHALLGPGTPGNRLEREGLPFPPLNDDEGNDLYCRTCRQFFSSLHNKKEHMLGKQHLQNLTGEFEKDSTEYLKHLELPDKEEVKEFELRELRKTLERARVEQEALQRQLAEFQSQQQRLEVELAGLKTYGVVLEKEFENLNTVLMLSHFGLQVMDTA